VWSRAPSRSLDLRDRGGDSGVRAEIRAVAGRMVVERDARAFAREGEPDRPAGSLSGTGDEHDLIPEGQIHGSRI
jgi:hypothetical protein